MLFYRGCQLAVYREWGAENVQAAFGSTCPAEIGAAAHYSVDLTWQFLPDLHRLTRQASPNDPLVEAIRHFATQWPLSSVGIAGIAPLSLAGIVGHPGLLRLYADRIIGREDVSRLADPAVCEAVQTALGAHTCLAPKFYQALHTPSLQSKTAQNLATGDNT
jgi:hypothetical protein